MLTKRIIPCLDVKNGKVVKGINFKGLRDVGYPPEMAAAYELQGADEITFLDITASLETRQTMLDIVSETAGKLFVPLTVGGGIRSVDDMRDALNAGADKVSVNSAAVKDPDIISEMEKVRMTWNVGQIEQTVATVLLRDKMDYVDHAAAVMAEESEIMNSSLEEIGFPAGPVSDSFFYFNSLEPLGMDAADFNKRMLRHGIMVRDCSSFGEDFRGYVRYSVKDRERNCRFIAAVDAVING